MVRDHPAVPKFFARKIAEFALFLKVAAAVVLQKRREPKFFARKIAEFTLFLRVAAAVVSQKRREPSQFEVSSPKLYHFILKFWPYLVELFLTNQLFAPYSLNQRDFP